MESKWISEQRRVTGPIRFLEAAGLLLRKRAWIVWLLVSIWLHIILFSFTLRLIACLFWTLAWDCVQFWLVWIRSYHRSYLIYQASTDHENYEISKCYNFSPVVNILIKIAFPVLKLLHGRSPINDNSNVGFRRFLSIVPPAFPVSSHDYFWIQDSEQNPCQIVGLAVTERIDINALRDLVSRRWLGKDPKLISAVRKLFGRVCWVPLPPCTQHAHDESTWLGTQDFSIGTSDTGFCLYDHVYELSVDPASTTVHEALSAIASKRLQPEKPRWEIVLLNPMPQPNSTDSSPILDLNPQFHEHSAGPLSCVVLKIHHGVADGIGIAVKLLNELFDPDPTVELRIPTQPYFGRWLVKTTVLSIYFAVNLLKCAFLGLRIIFFWGFWCTEPPATFQEETSVSRVRGSDQVHFNEKIQGETLAGRPMPKGFKYLSPPVLISTAEMNRTRELAEDLADVRPTINDIFAYCLTIVIGKLRSGEAVTDFRRKLLLRHERQSSTGGDASIDEEGSSSNSPGGLNRLSSFEETHSSPFIELNNYTTCLAAVPSSPLPRPVTPQERIKRRIDQICFGVPIDSPDIDLSTPTNLSAAITRFFPEPRRVTTTKEKFVGVRKRLRPPRHNPAKAVRTQSSRTDKIQKYSRREWKQSIELMTQGAISQHVYASSFEEHLQVLIPMTTRTSKPTRLDNFTGPVLVRLPLPSLTKEGCKNIEASAMYQHSPMLKLAAFAVTHLKVVKRPMDQIKKSRIGHVFFLLACLACKVFPDYISDRLVTSMSDRMQLLLTNIHGPRVRKFLGGKTVKSLQFWPPAKGKVTGGVSILSFDDQLQISTVFDEAEFNRVFPSEKLTRLEKAAMSQYVGNMIKYEFVLLHDLLARAKSLLQED